MRAREVASAREVSAGAILALSANARARFLPSSESLGGALEATSMGSTRMTAGGVLSSCSGLVSEDRDFLGPTRAVLETRLSHGGDRVGGGGKVWVKCELWHKWRDIVGQMECTHVY